MEEINNSSQPPSRKILTISAFFLILILIIAFFGYKYYSNINSKINESTEQKSKEPGQNITEGNEKQPDFEVPEGDIEAIGGGGGFLTICSDRCGDGICQKEDLTCEGNNLNCICAETSEECPQDCK